MERLKFTMDAIVKLDNNEVVIKSGTLFTIGEGMTVSEDTEIVVNGDLYLLERGDRINFSEGAEPKKKEEPKKLPSEDEWEKEENYEEYEEEQEEEEQEEEGEDE